MFKQALRAFSKKGKGQAKEWAAKALQQKQEAFEEQHKTE